MSKARLYIVSAGGLIVLLCSMVISFIHSIQLYSDYGNYFWMAIGCVVAMEGLFFTSTINMALAKMNGEKTDWLDYTIFLVGLGYVGWSNLHAYPETIGGVILGLSIPSFLLLMEAVFSRMTLQLVKSKTDTQMEKSKMDKHPDNVQTEKSIESPKSMDIQSVDKSVDIQTVDVEKIEPPLDKKPPKSKEEKVVDISTKRPSPAKEEEWRRAREYVHDYVSKYGKTPPRGDLYPPKNKSPRPPQICSEYIAKMVINEYKEKLQNKEIQIG